MCASAGSGKIYGRGSEHGDTRGVEGGFTRACIRLDGASDDGEIRRLLGDDRRLCLESVPRRNLVRKSRVYRLWKRLCLSTPGDFINPIMKFCRKRKRDLWDVFGRNPNLVFKAADS